MKLSVSLSEEDVRLLDDFAREHGLASRSATVQHAIRLLQQAELDDDYAAAFTEWADSDEEDAWDAVVGDGLTRAPR